MSGPSELGLSLALTASPDALPLDGVSQTLIGIFARDRNARALSNLRLSLQIATSRGFEDFGRLSTRSAVTGSDGRATVTYTVPLVPSNAEGAADVGMTVTVWVTPIGQDYGNEISRGVTIRLVPPGTVIPLFEATAGFAISPAIPTVFDQVRFSTNCADATGADCVRDPGEIITQYDWDFGDGSVASGPAVAHVYEVAGTYVVWLTIRDTFNRFAQASKSLAIGGGVPTAAITVSPTDPEPNDSVFFNGSGSAPAPGRTIVSYEWDFGDGATARGVTASHVYQIEGAFVTTLKVTDDRRQVGTVTSDISVQATGPTVSFIFTPTDPNGR